MVGNSARHAAVLSELVEWWQDLSQQQINSRAVLLPVPPHWGRTHLLGQFAKAVKTDDVLSLVVSIQGESLLGEGLAVQTQKLKELFSKVRFEHRAAELLGVDRLGGTIQLGLGVAGLFVTPLAALVGLLLASVGAGAASRVWDDSPAGQEGAIAKLARAVAALSVSVPVVVIIDDADWLELDLAVVLIENLIERINGQVLVVAAVSSDGKLLPALTSRSRYGLTEGRVRTVDADPNMEYTARVDLVTELRPNLPAAAARRIGRRTRTFVEVFEVTSAERLTELDAHRDDAAVITVIDEVINAHVFNPKPPSRQAVVLAWAGGVLHARQADRAVDILNEGPADDNGYVRRSESVARLADPASPRLAEQVRALTAKKRHRLAEVMVDTAVQIGRNPRVGLVEKVVAWQAAHRVRADLQDRRQLPGVQCQLVRGLEDLGDPVTAYQIAHTALADLYYGGHPGSENREERYQLSTAVLRLARSDETYHDDPLINATIAAATAGGAAVGLEARIWAAIDLLGQPDQRERTLRLTNQITAELSRRPDLGADGDRWRLLLAFHVGRSGYPAIAQRLLAPILTASDAPEDGDAARAVLYAVGGPGADTRLQIIALEEELAAFPPDAEDDLLRVHHALAADNASLGDYRRALHHGQQELTLRLRIQSADHPDTLGNRGNIAAWTGQSGHPGDALRLFLELLPDQKRVLGPDHTSTLNTRSSIATWTGRSGHPAEGLRLFRELLPDAERVLGSDHPGTLNSRHNIAGLTAETGHPAEGLRLFRELLPDQKRVLGPDHPETLTSRLNIAALTGRSGHPEDGLRLFRELLPDQERVLGPDHPETLTTRNNTAALTAESGHPEEALRLFRELLPDQEQVLGPDHPVTLTTRHNIAALTAESGHPEEALRLFRELFPDQKRVLGPDHPDTLRTLEWILPLIMPNDSSE